MLDHQDSPQNLMLALDKFLTMFWGEYKVEIQPETEIIISEKSPLTLKYLYSFIKQYPAPRNGSLFSTQDGLVINNYQKKCRGKFIIAGENQGVWSCGTELAEIDPPVWVQENIDRASWKLFCNSLAQFLVTLILQESVFGSKYIYDVSLEKLYRQDLEIIPLWKGFYPYNFMKDRAYERSFFLIEDSFLYMSGWCGTNYKNGRKLLDSFGCRRLY